MEQNNTSNTNATPNTNTQQSQQQSFTPNTQQPQPTYVGYNLDDLNAVIANLDKVHVSGVTNVMYLSEAVKILMNTNFTVQAPTE